MNRRIHIPNRLLGFLLLGLSGCATAPTLKLIERRELIAPGAARFDPSGLVQRDGRWFVISDKKEYPDLYRLRKSGENYFRADVYLKVRNPEELPDNDFEGMAICRGRIMIVEEKSSSLLTLKPDARFDIRKLDLPFVAENKGLEGIACAPDGRLWVAKEREPRRIYRLSRSSFAVAEDFDVEPLEGGTLSPDFSGLHFDGDHLYAIARNDRMILKIDPVGKELVKRAKIPVDENALYESEEPYGMAEGLFMTKAVIAVVLDNNGRLLRKGGKPHALFYLFKRPKGF